MLLSLRKIFFGWLVLLLLTGCGGSDGNENAQNSQQVEPELTNEQGTVLPVQPGEGTTTDEPAESTTTDEPGEGASTNELEQNPVDPIAETGQIQPVNLITVDGNINLNSPETLEESVRFLMRGTFGATQVEADQMLSSTYEAWVEDQFQRAPTLLKPQLLEKIGDETRNLSALKNRYRSDVWFNSVVNGRDQLRHRVAFALSQILVVSDKEGILNSHSIALADYYDMLLKNAFGNFRDVLEQMTLHSAMGNYLSSRGNRKGNENGTIFPDENFAREIMQLFTIGLHELNNDGTAKKDANGKLIPTYDLNTVRNFARVFTGWNYSGSDTINTVLRPDDPLVVQPMDAHEDYHDTESKVLLGGIVIAAGQSARADLEMALDNLFQHPNVGPFISKQLIQRLVASNPSPAYVARVSNKFNDNGNGVRGDLKAVIKAILLDEEALGGWSSNERHVGKLKEPLIKLVQIFRFFQAEGIVPGRIRYKDGMAELGQASLESLSVFNFFQPTYSQGQLRNSGLLAPEFQIYNDNTAIKTQNLIYGYVFDISTLRTSDAANKNKIVFDFSDLLSQAQDPAGLMNYIDLYLFAGDMSESTKNLLVEYISSIPMDGDGLGRVREAVFISLVSPEFALQR